MFLADEISLADDSVLERLNSVLEPERTLILAEKGSSGDSEFQQDIDLIVAESGFHLLGTMNPGGDYGTLPPPPPPPPPRRACAQATGYVTTHTLEPTDKTGMSGYALSSSNSNFLRVFLSLFIGYM